MAILLEQVLDANIVVYNHSICSWSGSSQTCAVLLQQYVLLTDSRCSCRTEHSSLSPHGIHVRLLKTSPSMLPPESSASTYWLQCTTSKLAAILFHDAPRVGSGLLLNSQYLQQEMLSADPESATKGHVYPSVVITKL